MHSLDIATDIETKRLIADQCSVQIASDCLTRVNLRPLMISDIPIMKELCASWFPIEYPDEWYMSIMSKPCYVTMAAEVDNRIVGMIIGEVKKHINCNQEDKNILSYNYRRQVDVIYILSIGVINEYRRQGIASILLNHLIDRSNTAEAIYLHVLTTNNSAIRFYERASFRRHRRLPFYYSIEARPHDAFCYVRYINEGHAPFSLADALRRLVNHLGRMKPCIIPPRIIFSFHKIWSGLTSRISAPLSQR